MEKFKIFMEANNQEIVAWVDSFFEKPEHNVLKIFADYLEDGNDDLSIIIKSYYDNSFANSFSKKKMKEIMSICSTRYMSYRVKFVTKNVPERFKDILGSFVNLMHHQDSGYGWEMDDNKWLFFTGRKLPVPVSYKDVPDHVKVSIFVAWLLWRLKIKLKF